MTPTIDPDADGDRIIQQVMHVVFRSAFACLGAGLVMWVVDHHSDWAGVLLPSGLLALMMLPTLGLLAAIATSLRVRDWWTFTATMAVLAILVTLMLSDALGLVR